jgi:hypothetical protein
VEIFDSPPRLPPEPCGFFRLTSAADQLVINWKALVVVSSFALQYVFRGLDFTGFAGVDPCLIALFAMTWRFNDIRSPESIIMNCVLK